MVMPRDHTHTSAISTAKYAHKYMCVCTTVHHVNRIMSYLGVCGNFGNLLLIILYLKVKKWSLKTSTNPTIPAHVFNVAMSKHICLLIP